MGMVGGGPGAFIGQIHCKAAAIAEGIELVSGAFSRNLQKAKQAGRWFHLKDNRIYSSYQEMIKNELKLSEAEQIDFVSIVTPNNSHFPIARDFLKAGFSVMCEKPMTLNIKEARQLKRIVKKSGRVFGLMHNYTGYPMVKLARDMVGQGELDNIRKIVVQYPQGWLADALEKTGHKGSSWRTDPKQAGAAGCIGDIGTHAANLTEYVTGLKITHICADLTTFVKGRKLEDDANCLLRFNNGAKGLLYASQISIGEENNLSIRVYGEKKSLQWHQERPDCLYVREQNRPAQLWRRGNRYVAAKSVAAARATVLPPGHPEGFIEAFASIYRNFADTMRTHLAGKKTNRLALDFPTVDDGLRGMLFIDTVLASAKSKQKWTPMKT